MTFQQSIELKVRGVALEKESGMPIILLQDQGKTKILPITIGPFEASTIIIELEGIHPPRPLTHDLITRIFNRHNFKMLHLEIYGYLEEKYLARIFYRKGIKKYTLEVRPSDGISLALRFKAPIFSSPELLELQEENTSYLNRLDPYSANVLYLDEESREMPFM